MQYLVCVWMSIFSSSYFVYRVKIQLYFFYKKSDTLKNCTLSYSVVLLLIQVDTPLEFLTALPSISVFTTSPERAILIPHWIPTI